MLRGQSNPDVRAEPAGAATERDELRLIGRVAAGERFAFELLYRAYYPRLRRFLQRMTRRPALIDELLDDTMLVVWHRPQAFNGTSKLSTWIFAIAYRKALKALQRLDEPRADPLDEPAAAAGEQPEQRLAQAQLRGALALALDGLSVEHRAVVELCYFHGMGYREIAEIVGCPVDTVKTRMFHARRRLRAALPGRAEDWL